MNGQSQTSGQTTQSATMGTGFLGGLDITTIGAMVVLASAFMRR